MASFLGGGVFQAFNTSTGEFLSGGKVYTYSAGTTTPKATYPTVTDANAGTNANANPVILDARGEATIVCAGATKLVLKDSSDNTIWTVDNFDATTQTIYDGNGNELITFTTTGSAVNNVNVTNAATGNGPIIGVAGGDTNVILTINGKGTSGVKVEGVRTNTAATTGYIGEVVSSSVASGSAISLTNATAANLTSISLTAGDWDIYGNAVFVGNSSTNSTSYRAGFSATSATLPATELQAIWSVNGGTGITTLAGIGMAVPPIRVLLSATTTYYLVVQAGFTVSTMTACGSIFARRCR